MALAAWIPSVQGRTQLPALCQLWNSRETSGGHWCGSASPSSVPEAAQRVLSLCLPRLLRGQLLPLLMRVDKATQSRRDQVVRDVAQMGLHHCGVQGQVVPQQLEVPGVILKSCLSNGLFRHRVHGVPAAIAEALDLLHAELVGKQHGGPILSTEKLLNLAQVELLCRQHKEGEKVQKIVRKYKESRSVFLITCKTCNRTVKHHGKSRSFLSAMKSDPTTPTSKLSLKTPERRTLSSANLNCDTSGSKSKSPVLIFRTPISEQSTPTPSSKNVSKTKKRFSQLKVLLSQSEYPNNPKCFTTEKFSFSKEGRTPGKEVSQVEKQYALFCRPLGSPVDQAREHRHVVNRAVCGRENELCVSLKASAYVENFETTAKFLRSQKFDIAEKSKMLYTALTEKLPTGIKLADSESRTKIQEGILSTKKHPTDWHPKHHS
ncbi:hypothetical protein MC885_016455 [Smutsia gigantea]|nr:hypothetical protein MC885_016455 [Smutsia gigantea]